MEFVRRGTETEFLSWKKQREFLITELSQTCLSLEEHDLVRLFGDIEREINMTMFSDATRDILHCFHCISVLFHLQRNKDLLSQFIDTVNRHLQHSERVVVAAAAKTIAWISRDVKENNIVFHNSLSLAKTLLLDRNSVFNALAILKRARKTAPAELNSILAKYFHIVRKCAVSADADTQRTILRLIKFRFERGDDANVSQEIDAVLSDALRLVESTNDSECHFGVLLLRILADTSRFRGSIDCDKLWRCCCQREVHICAAAADTIFTFIERGSPLPVCEGMIQCLAKKDDVSCRKLVGKGIRLFGKNLNVKDVLDIIIQVLNQWNCEDGEYCAFELVQEAVRVFGKDLDVTKIEVRKPCKHFVNCVAIDTRFATDSLISYFNDVIARDDTNELVAALNMHALLPDKVVFPFENVPLHYGGLLMENGDPDLHQAVAELMSTLQEFDRGAATCLTSLSLFEVEKRIRKKALDLMKPSPFYASQSLVCNWLVDSSFGVRKRGIKMLSSLAEYNPLEITPRLVDYLKKLCTLLAHSPDIRYCCKCASFLATVTKFCCDSAKLCLDDIVSVVLKIVKGASVSNSRAEVGTMADPGSSPSNAFLHYSHDSDGQDDSSPAAGGGSVSPRSISPVSETPAPSISKARSDCELPVLQTPPHESKPVRPIRNRIKFSLESRRLSDIFRDRPDLVKSPNRAKLLVTLTGKYEDKRDRHLIKAIANFRGLCEPYMTEILEMFNQVFHRRQNRKLLLAAVKALTKLSLSTYNGLNIRLRCPQLTVPLVGLMTTAKDDNLRLALVKLFGGAFDTVDIIETQSFAAANECNITSEDGMFTSFVLKHLLRNLHDRSVTDVKILTMICQSDPNGSAPFLPEIVNIFCELFEKGTAASRKLCFKYLLVLVQSARVEMVAMLPSLLPILMDNLAMISCVAFCTSLSIIMKSDFIECATSMYCHCLNLLSQTKDLAYFREMLFFLASMVVYQYQSLDSFVNILERCDLNEDWVRVLLDALTFVTQNVDIHLFISRLVMFILKVAKTYPSVSVGDLLISMGLRGFPAVHALFLLNSIGRNHPQRASFERILSSNVPASEDVKLIKDYTPDIPNYAIHPKCDGNQSFFTELEYPTEAQMTPWMSSLAQAVICNNPSPSIRACSEYLNIRTKLIHGIVRPAFLTCWRNASDADRDHFSRIIDKIIHEHKRVHRLVTDLIQIAFRSLCPMKLDVTRLVELSELRQFMMYALQDKIIRNPNDKVRLKMLMNLTLQLGRHSTSRALLSIMKESLSKKELAKWSGALGNWEDALKIYQEEKASVTKIIPCLERVNRWEDIIDLEKQVELLPDKEKEKVYDSLLWAYAIIRDNTKVSRILSKITTWNAYRRQFRIWYHILLGDYDYAQELIDNAFRDEMRRSLAFTSFDQNKIQEAQEAAQLLVDCQEVLNFKRGKTPPEQLASLWKRRVKYFKRNKTMWERTIDLWKVVVPISSNVSFYLKIIAQLRKSGHFALIDRYFADLMEYSPDTRVIIEKIKIMWARGNLKEALDAASYIGQLESFADASTLLKLSRRNPNPFPVAYIYKMSFAPSFDAEIRDYCLCYFNATSMASFFTALESSTKATKMAFSRNLTETFPEKIFQCVKEHRSYFSYDDKFFASLYRLSGDILLSEEHGQFLTAEQAMLMFKRSIDHAPNNAKSWRAWAFANMTLFGYVVGIKNNDYAKLGIHRDFREYASSAATAFVRLVDLQPANSLEYLCQLFSLIPKVDGLLDDDLYHYILTLPNSHLLKVLPQLSAFIAHDNERYRELVRELLLQIGEHYFQEIYFALNLRRSDNNPDKSRVANEISAKLRKRKPAIAEDADMFIDAMVRSALTWYEVWLHDLESIAALRRSGNMELCQSALSNLLQTSHDPKCELDRAFLATYGATISSCRQLLKDPSETAQKALWGRLVRMYESIKDRIGRMSVICLNKISEQVATKRNFELVVPGLNDVPMSMIEPILEVIDTQQHPRCIFIKSVDGTSYKFLLKGNEDLRLDSRLMQFFSLINNITSANDYDVAISRYAVIPLTKTVGLIRWVTGADTLHHIITSTRESQKIPRGLEQTLIDEEIAPITFKMLTPLQKYQLFCKITSKTTCREVFEAVWLRSPNAAIWMARTQRFTLSCASMSMVGHIIGLGDRHPGNLMVQRETGNIIHIDFGESFEKAANRSLYPERVPFRLTKMIVNALEGSTENGLFKKACERIMKVMRDNASTLKSHLAIFATDPLGEGTLEKDSGRLAERCNEKVEGREFGETLPVVEQVGRLIRIAADPYNYAQHYPGWCPFW